MSPSPQRAKDIFAQALEKKSPAERTRFLDDVCRDSPQLRDEVESLLRAHERAGGFLVRTLPVPISDIELEPTGARIGRYKLIERLGEGGFGVVYLAEQKEPVQRKVALKIIKPGMDTKEVIARFEAERQALALMDHPNIARVLDGGATHSGRPYFVMELVPGIPMTEYCDQHSLSPARRLELFIKVCQAVQHAHQKGIIHRDIKPSNVLVMRQDGELVPKVIDFGVARALGQKLTEKTLFTAIRQMVGTPAYMSPEQADTSGVDIDTRSDIYSLGVLLYELLTGVTPFDCETLARAGVDEIRRMLGETEPPRPSTRLLALGDGLTGIANRRYTEPAALARFVRGDLDWIVMKCLEKDRARRYETANGLATEIRRFLNHEPVTAGPPTALYRARKFVHRHKGGLAVAGALAVLLAAGVVVSTWQALRASRNASEARRLAIQSARLAQAELAQRQRAERLTQQIRENLYRADVRLAMISCESPFPRVVSVTLSPDRTVLAARAADGAIRLWQAKTGRLLRAVQEEPGEAGELVFSPDGRMLCWGTPSRCVAFLDSSTGTTLARLPGHKDGIFSVAFCPRSPLVASASIDGTVRLWNQASLKAVATLSGHKEGVIDVAFSPDGRTLASSSGDRTVKLWNVATLRELLVIKQEKPANYVAFSPDGRNLITVSDDHSLLMWSLSKPAAEPGDTGLVSHRPAEGNATDKSGVNAPAATGPDFAGRGLEP